MTPVWRRTDEVDQHVPLSSVVGGIGEQELDQAPVHRLLPLCRLQTGLEEVVAALDLWEEETRASSVVFLPAEQKI